MKGLGQADHWEIYHSSKVYVMVEDRSTLGAVLPFHCSDSK